MISYHTYCIWVQPLPLAMTIITAIVLLILPLENCVSLLISLTPENVFVRKRMVSNGKDSKGCLLSVGNRIVPAQKTIRAIRLMCVLVIFTVFASSVIFLYSLFPTEIGCPSDMLHNPENNWQCGIRKSGASVNCLAVLNKSDATVGYDLKDTMCIRFSGDYPLSAGSALGCYKMIYFLFGSVSSFFDWLKRKCGKCCPRVLFVLISLCALVLPGIYYLYTNKGYVHINMYSPSVLQYYLILVIIFPVIYLCYDIAGDEKQVTLVDKEAQLITSTIHHNMYDESKDYGEDRNECSHCLLSICLKSIQMQFCCCRKQRYNTGDLQELVHVNFMPV